MICVMRVLGFVHQLNNKKDLAEGYVPSHICLFFHSTLTKKIVHE